MGHLTAEKPTTLKAGSNIPGNAQLMQRGCGLGSLGRCWFLQPPTISLPSAWKAKSCRNFKRYALLHLNDFWFLPGDKVYGPWSVFTSCGKVFGIHGQMNSAVWP